MYHVTSECRNSLWNKAFGNWKGEFAKPRKGDLFNYDTVRNRLSASSECFTLVKSSCQQPLQLCWLLGTPACCKVTLTQCHLAGNMLTHNHDSSIILQRILISVIFPCYWQLGNYTLWIGEIWWIGTVN